MQEIAIAMRTSRGPVAMTETRGELLHLPLGSSVNPMAFAWNTVHMDASRFITFFGGLALKICWSFRVLILPVRSNLGDGILLTHTKSYHTTAAS